MYAEGVLLNPQPDCCRGSKFRIQPIGQSAKRGQRWREKRSNLKETTSHLKHLEHLQAFARTTQYIGSGKEHYQGIEVIETDLRSCSIAAPRKSSRVPTPDSTHFIH